MNVLESRTKLIDLYYAILEKGLGELPQYKGYTYRYDEDNDLLYVTRVLERVDEKGEMHVPIGFDYFDDSVTFLNKKSLKYIDFGTIKELKFNTPKFPKSLVSVRGDYIVKLGANTFSELYSLKSVIMPNLDYIGISCFSGCKSLKTIDVSKVTTIEDYAFMECDNLTTLNFQSLELSSASDVFSHSGLVHFTADNLIMLDNSFFAHANNLEWVYAPNLSNLGRGLFKGCLRLKHCEFGVLDDRLFENYLTSKNYLQEHTILTGKDVYDVYMRNANELFLILPSLFTVNTFLKSANLKFSFKATDFEVASLIIQFVTLAYIARESHNNDIRYNVNIKSKFLSCYKQGKFMGLKNIRFEIKIYKE